MRPLRDLLGCGVLLALAGCGSGGEGVDEGGATRQPPDTPAVAAVGTLPQGVSSRTGEEGRAIYQRLCVMCHGERGQGNQLGPPLTDGRWSAAAGQGTYPELIAVVRDGVAAPDSFPVPMHPRGDGTLTDLQVQAVAAYAYSLSRPTSAAP